ncbi:helix-turn-helix domain-containing protein [Desulfosporosinus fructosivorans]|nr:helix-turn-helix domain-containing protein [Desulfosporosinus fructosivorans]
MKQVKNIFKTRLKILRNESNITQNELAEALHISKQTVSNYESGSREPEIDILTSISSYFNVSVDYLIGVGDTKSHRLASVNNKLGQLNTILEQKSGVEFFERNVTPILNVFLDLVLRHVPDPHLMLEHYTDILVLLNSHDLFLDEVYSSAPFIDYDIPALQLSKDEDAKKLLEGVKEAIGPNLAVSNRELDTTHKISKTLFSIKNAYMVEKIESLYSNISPNSELGGMINGINQKTR